MMKTMRLWIYSELDWSTVTSLFSLKSSKILVKLDFIVIKLFQSCPLYKIVLCEKVFSYLPLPQGHLPLQFTSTFSRLAKQAFLYSFRSVPHTGSSVSRHSNTEKQKWFLDAIASLEIPYIQVTHSLTHSINSLTESQSSNYLLGQASRPWRQVQIAKKILIVIMGNDKEITVIAAITVIMAIKAILATTAIPVIQRTSILIM